jgi:hypothetical protein
MRKICIIRMLVSIATVSIFWEYRDCAASSQGSSSLGLNWTALASDANLTWNEKETGLEVDVYLHGWDLWRQKPSWYDWYSHQAYLSFENASGIAEASDYGISATGTSQGMPDEGIASAYRQGNFIANCDVTVTIQATSYIQNTIGCFASSSIEMKNLDVLDEHGNPLQDIDYVGYGTGTLTGTLQVSLYFKTGEEGFFSANTYAIAPEPATLFLLGLGAVILRKRS